MSKPPTTALDTLFLDPSETDTLIQIPEQQLRNLGLSSISELLPTAAAGDEWQGLPISTDISANIMLLIVVNRTDTALKVIEKPLCPDGNLDYQAWDEHKADRRTAAAPREELGQRASCVGIWKLSEGGHNPSCAIKFEATPATGNRPVYVAGDITQPLFGDPTVSCSVGNFEHGSAQDYFDQFVDGGSDYGKWSSSSGCVSAKGYRTQWAGGNSWFWEWVICAVVAS
ncbi:MAG: hypothetical protein K9L70_10960 [Thiohalocapsa sp.]|nr:hypothetical protein [Thiohalocapsa sp.]